VLCCVVLCCVVCDISANLSVRVISVVSFSNGSNVPVETSSDYEPGTKGKGATRKQ
jgi:hypothetical protein